jgi:hypothetical protein
MNPSKTNGDELNAIQNINKIIHEPARLLIMAHLFVVESADFHFLQRQTGLTWGQHILVPAQAGECRLRCSGEGVHRQEASHNVETHEQRTKSLPRIQKKHEAGIRGPAKTIILFLFSS